MGAGVWISELSLSLFQAHTHTHTQRQNFEEEEQRDQAGPEKSVRTLKSQTQDIATPPPPPPLRPPACLKFRLPEVVQSFP